MPFRLRDDELDAKFLRSRGAGPFAAEGTPLRGGCAPLIYNAMPMEGVESLLEFMEEFRVLHG
jgi:phosphoserine aminotransferase